MTISVHFNGPFYLNAAVFPNQILQRTLHPSELTLDSGDVLPQVSVVKILKCNHVVEAPQKHFTLVLFDIYLTSQKEILGGSNRSRRLWEMLFNTLFGS